MPKVKKISFPLQIKQQASKAQPNQLASPNHLAPMLQGKAKTLKPYGHGHPDLMELSRLHDRESTSLTSHIHRRNWNMLDLVGENKWRQRIQYITWSCQKSALQFLSALEWTLGLPSFVIYITSQNIWTCFRYNFVQ